MFYANNNNKGKTCKAARAGKKSNFMYMYLKTIKQRFDNSAMETGDHSKNGASPKSLTSRGKFYFVYLLLAATMIFAGCDKDNQDNPDNSDPEETIVPDPEGTITANISKSSSIDVSTANTYFGVIRWDSPDNFYLTVNMSPFTGTFRYSICNLGAMKGLGNITSIPSTGGFTTPSHLNDEVACETGHGYVMKFDRGNDVVTEKIVYVRLYVVESIVSTSGGIMGAKVKYQYPFNP
jgi:hypothetical protein